MLAQVAEPLPRRGVTFETFDRVEPEPGVELVRECVAAARAFNPDVVVGLGGGSNMDPAKLAAMVLAHGGDPLDYIGDGRVPGRSCRSSACRPPPAPARKSRPRPCSPTPTTRSRCRASASTCGRRSRSSIRCFTVTCPPKVTADTGIDALTHAIEAFTAVDNDAFPLPSGEKSVYQGKNPLADVMASEAITLVGQFLRRAVKDGNDLEARDGMALAATLGGLAFSNAGVALVHAMEYPVGGAVHVSHGAGNGLLLPFVMRFNLPERECRRRDRSLLGDGPARR